MGAIQSSINQVLGTAAAGVALGKHAVEAKETKKLAEEQKVENALDAQVSIGREVLSTNEEQKATTSEIERVSKEQKALKDIANTPGAIRSQEDVSAYKELSRELNNDLLMAEVARRALVSKKKAISLRMERSADTLRKAGIINDLVSGGKK